MRRAALRRPRPRQRDRHGDRRSRDRRGAAATATGVARHQPHLLQHLRIVELDRNSLERCRGVAGRAFAAHVRFALLGVTDEDVDVGGRVRLLTGKLCRNSAMSAIWAAENWNGGMAPRPSRTPARCARLSDLPARWWIAGGLVPRRRRPARSRHDRTRNWRRITLCLAQSPPHRLVAAADTRRSPAPGLVGRPARTTCQRPTTGRMRRPRHHVVWCSQSPHIIDLRFNGTTDAVPEERSIVALSDRPHHTNLLYA